MKPAAFLFDLDGTLIDSEGAWARAIVSWLAAHGQQAECSEILALIFGHSWPDVDALVHAKFPALGAVHLKNDAVELREHYARVVRDPASQIIPSAVAFLRQVSRLAPCVIVSGSPHRDVQAAAELCGISGCLRFVLGSDDYGRGKPAPDGFLKAATMLDVDASECVVVEDSTVGVAAGRAAGMQIIGVNRHSDCVQDFSGCDWLVHDLAELDVRAVFGEDVGLTDQARLQARSIIGKIASKIVRNAE